MTKHILVVDDDAQIRQLLYEYLTTAGFQVSTVGNGLAARAAFAEKPIDMVLLDIVLPDIDGTTLAKEFLASSDTPIIMLTVKGEEIERVVGLELGADDYITKPFSPRELLARIRAIFRRAAASVSHAQANTEFDPIFIFGEWELHPATRRIVKADGTERRLTASEFGLLSAFLQRPKHVLTRDQLLAFSRADPEAVYDRSIDYLILRLRRKLEDVPRQPRIIKTEHGVGYVLAVDVAKRPVSS